MNGARWCDHILHVLVQLHWLPVRRRVEYKVVCPVHPSLSGQAPAYLTHDINLVADSGRRFLRSAVDRTCVVPHTTIRTATRVSLLLVCMCGTVCHRTYYKTLTTGYSSETWKHFCLDNNWLQYTVTALFSVCIWNSLTYLLIYFTYIWRHVHYVSVLLQDRRNSLEQMVQQCQTARKQVSDLQRPLVDVFWPWLSCVLPFIHTLTTLFYSLTISKSGLKCSSKGGGSPNFLP